MTADRKTRIAQAFSAQAQAYENAAPVQRLVAARLAERIAASAATPPRRILEIGCGTGLLSAHLASMFPESDLLLTDISPAMLARCRATLGNRPRYQLLDGEHPASLDQPFDLIASSLAFQWFTDLRGAIERLSRLLTPNGRLLFATLGSETFIEWRRAHAALNLPCGTQTYPSPETFPWPTAPPHTLNSELITHPYANGAAFARSLKTLGAREPAPTHRPLPPGTFRRLLTTLNGNFPVTYHVLYGEVSR